MRNERWDAVLLDGHMPEMNSDEPPLGLAAPPMILLSKPVRRQQLHRALVKSLDGVGADRSAITTSAKMLDPNFARRVPLRILLAEDNLVNQKVATRMLERLGYRIDAVANGAEALEALRKKTYDIVLMDVHMPVMNGLDATKQVIAEWGDESPWITALTAGAMKENRDECFAAGVNDFLTKPINVSELQEGLTRCFRKRKVAAKERLAG
jgi:CheY-like chemotaxis protein